MNARKTKGIGFLIGGTVFIIVGAVFLKMDATPEWVSIGMILIGKLADVFGFTVVFPDVEN